MIPEVARSPKKINFLWVLSIVFFVSFIIALSVDMSDDTELTGKWIESGEHYVCADYLINGDTDGRQYVEADEVNDGHDDCSDGSDEDGSYDPIAQAIGTASCCFSILFGIIAISVRRKQQKIITIQQQPQFVPVVQQVVQPIQRVAPGPAPLPAQRVGTPASTSVANLAETAKNLEKARDFEAAAKMYQKAGMYEDAGRVRQAHLEKEDQAMVQIGQVGNTVLNDSVMIAESTPKTCASCGNVSEPSWKICPHCSNPL
jgi:hypothetical protein